MLETRTTLEVCGGEQAGDVLKLSIDSCGHTFNLSTLDARCSPVCAMSVVKDAVQRKDVLQMLLHPFVLNTHNPEVIAKRVKDSIDAKIKTPSKTDKIAKMAAAKTIKFVNKLRQKRAGEEATAPPRGVA